MVATGYEFGSPAVIHKDVLEDYNDVLDAAPQHQRTPRLDMNEAFFGESFGEPLDFLMESNLQFEKKDIA